MDYQQQQEAFHQHQQQGGFADSNAFQQADGFQQAGGFPPADGAHADAGSWAYAGQGPAVSSYADGTMPYAEGVPVNLAGDMGSAYAPAMGSSAYAPATSMYTAPPVQAPSQVGLVQQRPLVIIPLCRKGDRAGIERQVQAGASVQETDVEGNTPLHVAVEAPKNEIATVQCLLEHGSDANALNFIGATPLHYVCLRKSNYRGVANILLENGAQINRQTVAGKTALHFACENQLPELVEVLCLFGADTNLADVDGNTPVHLTLNREGGRDTVKRDILEHLVTYRAGCAWANTEGLTPVLLSCQNGYIRCLQYLVQLQQDPAIPASDATAVNAKTQNGVHLACLHGHAQVAQLMLQLFPQFLNAIDFEGNTPLHCCAHVGNLECALVLLKLDANTSIRNIHKKTAFEVAKVRGTDLSNTHNSELVEVLKDANKSASCRNQ